MSGSSDRDTIEVIMPPGIIGPFSQWLDSRGLYLFPITTEGPLPSYGIGVR